jgi:6-phosphogluconolactonase (cycloisomerase 2 family)
MAPQNLCSYPSFEVFRASAFRNTHPQAAGFLLILSAALIGAVPAGAQTPQQQYVYGSVPLSATSSEIAGFAKGPAGVLSGIGSPLPDAREGGLVAADAKGRFLFVVNPVSDDISMFQIDQTSGSLTEVSGSPFAAGPTENPTTSPASPVCLATESSGQFLYVGYRSGNFPGESAIIVYQIDAATLRLVPPSTASGSTDILSAPVGMVTDPKGRYLYVGLGETTSVYPIDPSTGQLIGSGTAGKTNPGERTIAIDPQGRFFFDGWGSEDGFIESAPVSPFDGTATPVQLPLNLGQRNFPTAMLVDSSGKFLYVQERTGVYAYAIDATTGALGQPQGPLLTLSFQTGSAAADPQGPYIYSLQPDGVHGFQMDPQFGGISPVQGSPFSVAPGGGLGGLAISGAPVQAVSGPVAAIFPSFEDFGGVVVGQSSNTRMVSLTNTGDQLLSLNSVAPSGADAGDFSAVPNCQLPALLSANATCSISVTFKPIAAGSRQASLTISDNAAAGTQSIPLSGTGVAPEPAVTLLPGSVSFPSTAQGATSAAQSVMVTSSGAASLHISSVLVGGTNPADFAMTSSCNGAFLVGASCKIGVTFSPLGDGLRTAAVSIADDAPGSPQSVELSGSGIGPPVLRPGVALAPRSPFQRPC